jgi:hypothetical protein
MSAGDRPFRLPDLTDVLAMEKLAQGTRDASSPEALEEAIIRYVDDVRNRLREMLIRRPEPDIALGETSAVRPAIRFLQVGVHRLLEAGRLLSPKNRSAYLRHLLLVIMASYNVGGFARLTKTAAKLAVAEQARHANEGKLLNNKYENRREIISEIDATLRPGLGSTERLARINEALLSRGMKTVKLRTLQRVLQPSKQRHPTTS